MRKHALSRSHRCEWNHLRKMNHCQNGLYNTNDKQHHAPTTRVYGHCPCICHAASRPCSIVHGIPVRFNSDMSDHVTGRHQDSRAMVALTTTALPWFMIDTQSRTCKGDTANLKPHTCNKLEHTFFRQTARSMRVHIPACMLITQWIASNGHGPTHRHEAGREAGRK